MFPSRAGLLAIVMLAPLLATQHTSDRAIAQANGRFWVTNGPVYAAALSDTTLYIGGDFTTISPASGSLAALDSASGAHDPTFPQFAGFVETIAADGDGGWYVGGRFTGVNGVPRHGLARLRSD